VFPPAPQPQSADPQPVAPTGRRPIADYSPGEIAADGAKSFGVGVGRFGIQAAGSLGDAREMLANGAQRAADYFAPGSAPNAGSKVSDFLASYPLLAGPTSSQLQSAVESYTGPFYQPKTIVGDYAQTAGEFVPGALLMPEGSLATNALRYGVLPAISSETAGQLTKGTAAEPWARAAGGILGAAANTWRGVPWARSAPAVAEPLAESELSTAKNIPQITLNKAAGDAWEAEATKLVLSKTQADIQPQITVNSNGPSELSVRLDAVGKDRTTGEIVLSDMKASETAPLTRNQTIVYPELERHGGTVVGKGKAPYVGGTQIPPTKVAIMRKPAS
jgi:filamentous hemagglutinin